MRRFVDVHKRFLSCAHILFGIHHAPVLGMDSGYYAALSGLLARSQALDTAANNLANASTNGFRAENNFFRDTILGPNASNSQLNSRPQRLRCHWRQSCGPAGGAADGDRQPSGRALQGAGFFTVQTAAGVRYTRDGAFQRASDGTLRTSRNERVLNAPRKPHCASAGAGRYRARWHDLGGGRCRGTHGSCGLPCGNGSWSLKVPRSFGPRRSRRGQRFRPRCSKVVSRAPILTLSLARCSSCLIQRQAEMMQKALSIFYSEFNKTATEDLAKV